jgi:thiamine kinase-like enzyme
MYRNMSVITFDQITPEWLTTVLKQNGSLLTGRVTNIKQVRDPNPMAYNVTLHVVYSEDAQGTYPADLFFKQNRNTEEARFYRHIASTLHDVAVLTCYDVQYNDSNSHLLLQYVEGTHFTAPDALPMPLLYNEMIVDALADLHFQFWDRPRLSLDIGTLAPDVPASMFDRVSQHFPAFVDYLGERLSSRRRSHYEKILASYPQYRPSTSPKTLVHGDAHWGNFLYPHDPAAHKLYMIDWAVWNINFGVGDLAYNIALQCYPERRTRIEQPLIRRYHDRLLKLGVQDYSWERCWEDYRRMVIEQCLWIIFWQHWDLSPNIWWFALECTLAAFEDLGCEDFL